MKSDDLYRALIDLSTDAILVTDLDFITILCNRQAATLYGFTTPDELTGRNAFAQLSLADSGSITEKARSLLDTGSTCVLDCELSREDGSTIPAEVSVALLIGSDDMPAGIRVLVRNSTERKRAEAALTLSEQRYRQQFERNLVGLYRTDADGRILDCNEALAKLLGCESREDLLGRLATEFYFDVSERNQVLTELHDAPGMTNKELRLRRKDGVSIWVLESASKIEGDSDGDGDRQMVIEGSMIDITQRKWAEDALRGSERRYRQLFEHNLAGVYRTNWDGKVLDCNEALVKMLGLTSKEELLGKTSRDFYMESGDRRAMLEKLKVCGSLSNLEQCYVRTDGSRMWALENVSLVEGDDTETPMLEGTIIDITERKMLVEQLTHQAFHDGLTKLPNRVSFMDKLQHALNRARSAGEFVAVLFLDLDNFKVVNDSLGHKTGDQLLISVGERLMSCVRSSDTVARLGGDEFTLLVENVRRMEDATGLAERVAELLTSPFNLDGREVFLSTSVGIAVSAGDEPPADVLRNADLAMYQAKSFGKARYSVYEPALNRRIWQRMQSETDLRRALDANELVLHYQPVVRLNSGDVVEMEALVRWQPPGRGLVLPSEFIPLAEETGLIVPLGQWVLREACRQAGEWQQQVPGASNLMLSVNLSPRQFRHPRLVDDIHQVLFETGFSARNLKLEITEGTGLDNTPATVTTLRTLKNMGIQIAIDDFGTGYSALSYLKDYPIDCLKLDRAFIGGLGRTLEDTAIIRAVIAFARILDLKVIAEGIETIEQLTQLREFGCNWGQGYYFARPLPATAAGDLLAERAALRTGRLITGRLSETTTGRLL